MEKEMDWKKMKKDPYSFASFPNSKNLSSYSYSHPLELVS
jgi:hypothetical protein